MTNKTLRGMISKAMILAAVLPILYLGAFLYHSQTASFNQEEEQRSITTLNSVIAAIEGFDSHNRSILRSFAAHPQVQAVLKESVDEQHVTKVIYNYYRDFPSIDSIYIGTSDGKHFSRKKALVSPSYDPRQRPWYQLAQRHPGTVVVTDPYENAVAPGSLSVTYALTLESANGGDLQGVVGCDILIADLSRLISAVAQDQNFAVVVTGGDGKIIFCQAPSLKENLIGDAALTAAVSESNYRERRVISGETYQVFGKLEPETGWQVYVYVSDRPLAEKQRAILFNVGVLMIAMIVISIAGTYGIVRFIMGHIDEFVARIKEINFDSIPDSIHMTRKPLQELCIIKETLDDMLARMGGQALELTRQKEEIQNQYEEIEALYEQSASLNGVLNDTIQRLKESNTETIRALSSAIEAKDEYTLGHCERVTEYAVRLGKRVGLSDEAINDLELAAVLHDVGKVAVPLEILNKPGRLTVEEYAHVKQHPELGYQITRDLQFMKRASRIIRQHHEWYDGSGFPQGMAGGDIETEARILSIADAYDAMTSARAYRVDPLSCEDALNELNAYARRQFDPVLTALFIDMMMVSEIESEQERV